MTREQAEKDMVAGYLDGLDLAFPEPHGNRSQSYRHGFRVGRAEKADVKLYWSAAIAQAAAEQSIEADTASHFH